MIKLVSLLHDPEGRTVELIKENVGKIRYLFGTFTVVVSNKTNNVVLALLQKFGVDVKFDDGEMYLAYKYALQLGAMSNYDHVLVVDFDRLLVWVKKHLYELEEIKKFDQYDYVILERTEPAFRTHPEMQQKTESLANYYVSKLLGYEHERDFFAGAWMFSKDVAWYIVDNSKIEHNGFYPEWHILAKRVAKNVGFVKCNGLEWETPYFYKNEIADVGLDKWKENFNEDEKRLKLFYLMMQAAKDVA